MTAIYHRDIIQGSDSWHALRCGRLTASEMKLIITPTLKAASNDKERAHLYELLSQRITQYVEPQYISADILRGKEDEIEARIAYSQRYAPVEEIGFITNDKWGFTIGYSPDGLVGDYGLLECKSRRQKYQAETILEFLPKSQIMPEYVIQAQTGLLVAEDREWVDHLAYCGGMPMVKVRVWPDAKVQEAIVQAAGEFERRLTDKLRLYKEILTGWAPMLTPTERRVEQEMYV